MKYVKVMFGQTSGANKDLKYKIGSVNIDKNWNPDAENPKDMGGFNFSTEDKILRWLSRGDTIYDVEIPKDAQMIDCSNKLYPNGIYRANKIILTNPRPVTDSMAKQFYFKSNLKDKSYFKSLAGCAVRGYKNTALQILKDKVNENNVKEALEIYEEFLAYGRDKGGDINLINEIKQSIKNIPNQKFNVKVGTIASGDIFCTDIKMKNKIKEKFDAYAIEMEGAAIAQVCKLDNIPFVIIRSISDKPNGKNAITFDEFLKKASKNCAHIINEFFYFQGE